MRPFHETRLSATNRQKKKLTTFCRPFYHYIHYAYTYKLNSSTAKYVAIRFIIRVTTKRHDYCNVYMRVVAN